MVKFNGPNISKRVNELASRPNQLQKDREHQRSNANKARHINGTTTYLITMSANMNTVRHIIHADTPETARRVARTYLKSKNITLIYRLRVYVVTPVESNLTTEDLRYMIRNGSIHHVYERMERREPSTPVCSDDRGHRFETLSKHETFWNEQIATVRQCQRCNLKEITKTNYEVFGRFYVTTEYRNSPDYI